MVDLLGLNSLSNEFGLVTMCQGLSAFIGAPIAGTHTRVHVYTHTHTHSVTHTHTHTHTHRVRNYYFIVHNGLQR